jgi:hypothetical protein
MGVFPALSLRDLGVISQGTFMLASGLLVAVPSLACAVLLAARRRAATPHVVRLIRGLLFAAWAAAAVPLIAGVAGWVSPDPGARLCAIWALRGVAAIAAFLVARAFVAGDRRARNYLSGMVASGILLEACSLIWRNPSYGSRLGSSLNPNGVGWLACALLFAAPVLYGRRGLAVAAPSALFIVASGSRTAAVSAIAGVVLLALLWARQRISLRAPRTWLRAWGAAALVAVVAASAAASAHRIADRFLATSSRGGVSTLERRLALDEGMLTAFKASPAIGQGNQDPVFEDQYGIEFRSHNSYISILYGGGLLSAVPAFAAMAVVIALVVLRRVQAVWAALFVAGLVTAITEDVLFKYEIASHMLWQIAFWAVAFTAARQRSAAASRRLVSPQARVAFRHG